MEQWLPQSKKRGDTVIDGVLMAFELSDLISATGCVGGTPATSTPATASAGAGMVHGATTGSILSVGGILSGDMGMALGEEATVPAGRAPADAAANTRPARHQAPKSLQDVIAEICWGTEELVPPFQLPEHDPDSKRLCPWFVVTAPLMNASSPPAARCTEFAAKASLTGLRCVTHLL